MRRSVLYHFRSAVSALAWALALFGSLAIGVQPAAAFEIDTNQPFTYRNGKLRLSGTSAQIAGGVSDETGTGALVFGTGPTLDGPTLDDPTITGTATLPAGFIGSLSAIHSDLLSGDGSELATVKGSKTVGKQATFDANGNLVASEHDVGAGGGGSSVNPVLSFASQGDIEFSAASGPVYLGVGTGVSTTEGRVRTPTGGGTFKNLACYASGSLGGSGATVTAGSGACTGSLTYPNSNQVAVTVTSTTAVSDTSHELVVSAGQCIALKVEWSDTTSDAVVNCTLEKVANS